MGAGKGQNKRRSTAATKVKLPVLNLKNWEELLRRTGSKNISLANYYFDKSAFDMGNGRPFFTSKEMWFMLNEILRDAITEGIFQFTNPVNVDDFKITSRQNSPKSLLGIDREIITIEYSPADTSKMTWEVPQPWYRFPFEKMKDIETDLVTIHAAIWGIFKQNKLDN